MRKTQTDAVIEAMQRQGGFATLRTLYEEVPNIEGVSWNTKTPQASIRRIVQDERHFFKIEPGLWALKSYLHRLPRSIINLLPGEASSEKRESSRHYYYQGMLLEIGNLKEMDTYVPHQDKGKPYTDKTLGDVATVNKLPEFTWPDIIKKIASIDVIWMKDRFPASVFEVENTTTFERSFAKFGELSNFTTTMVIVAPLARREEFRSYISHSLYRDLQKQVKFWSYEDVQQHYNAALSTVCFGNAM